MSPVAASRAGSIHSRMAYRLSPQMSTEATPSIVWSRSAKKLSAISESSRRLYRSDDRLRKTTGSPSAFDFEMTGSSASSGIWPRARLTRSRTSAAAASRSAPRSNSTRTVLRPWLLVDVIDRIPSMAFTDSSMGSVTWLSTTAAFAPRRSVLTEITGVCTTGYSRTPSSRYPIAPPIRITSEKTVARTGRRTETS